MPARSISFVASVVSLLQFIASSIARPVLRVNSNGTFKLALFCDLHFGENVLSNDEKSVAFERIMLRLEAPDLVVIDGDASSNYAAPDLCTSLNLGCLEWYSSNWRKFTEPMETAGVPYAYTLGNHDRIPGARPGDIPGNETTYALPDHWIVQHDMTNPHSLTQDGPAAIHGASNFVLPVLGLNARPVAYIWLLDSSDNECEGVPGWGCVYPDQVEWFRETAKQFAARDGTMLPGVVFHHIPLDEVAIAWNDNSVEVNGTRAEGLCCSPKNTGLFDSLKAANIWGVFHGHDHNNDFVALYEGIRIGYGRKSGYGGYGGPVADRPGSRIIQLTANSDGSVAWDTWIREDTGNKVVQTKSIRGGPPQQCCGRGSADFSPPQMTHLEKAAHACRVYDDAAGCRLAVGMPLYSPEQVGGHIGIFT